ncbi:MAG: S8 family serine peptidase [Phycisphaerales bacterium]|nr:S8 family serine peptidase [Phycisphaerales bacterium]
MMLRTFAALGLGSLVAASAIATTGPASVEAKKTRATDDTRRVIIDTGLDSADPISLPMMTARPIMKNPARSVEVRPVDLVPKKPTASLRIPTDPKTGDSLASGTLTVKFRDDLKARAGVVAGDRALSLLGQDLTSIDNIVAKYGANIRQLIMLPQDSIDLIEQKAFAHSNRRQPDLASMMRIEFPAGTQENLILAAAREFNERPELQWVTVDLKLKTAMGPPPQGCDAMNEVICNRPNPNEDPAICWDGNDATPAPFIGACNPAPGDDEASRYGCADAACCELVAGINDNCNEEDAGEGWDVYCAGLANLYCEGSVFSNDNLALASPDRYDPCLSTYDPDAMAGGAAGDPTPEPDMAVSNPVFANIAGFLLGSCFEPHPAPGCLKPDCCASVCVIDPACCSIDWDANCVALTATLPDVCTTPAEFVKTEQFTSSVDADGQTIGIQAYTSAPKVAPTNLMLGIFDGGGYDLAGMENLVGTIWRSYGSGATNGGVIPNPDKVWLYGAEYQVVYENEVTPEEWANAEQILPETPVDPRGPGNPFPAFASDPAFDYSTIRLLGTGERIQGAVVEFAAFVKHEDLELEVDASDGSYIAGVIPEPGLTIALLDQSFNNHGTACLGTMGGINNDYGVRGIASGAEMWFFPTVSIEDGARLETAMASVIQYLEPGAVINYSIGYGGGNMLTALPANYTLVRAASDAGLTTSCSAGNDCVPCVDEAGDDSGAMIVGAINPGMEVGMGAPPCNTSIRRASFSNYTDGGATVSINAWGLAGATPGYGDLFNGDTQLQPDGTFYNPPRDLDPLEVNNLRSYSAQFNGTSFSSPQNAGAAIWMQGLSMMFFDTTLSPEQLRDQVLTAGRENCTTLGPNSFGNDNPCGGDFIVQEQANPVGIYPNLPACGVQVITRVGTGYSGKVRVYTGTLLRGSRLSLGFDDGNKIVIRSEFAGQGGAEGGLAYLATGETTDIGVVFNSGWVPEEVENAALSVISQATAAVVLEVAWVKNVSTNRYQPMGVSVMTAGETNNNYDLGATFPASNFFAANGNVDVRIYTVGLGFIGVPNYQTKFDQISLVVNDPTGPNDP